MNHLLRAFLWTLLALFLGCLALVAEAQEARPAVQKSPRLKYPPLVPLKAHGSSGGYSKASRTL